MHGKYSLPVEGVSVSRDEELPVIVGPLLETDNLRVSPHECLLSVPEVGRFYIREGREVVYSVASGADPEWVKLCLNGQVLVALLHQRKIINFHASSFIYNDRGVMILGETGAGKSSLTVSFALTGAGFLTDDLTPVIFKRMKPYIWPLSRDVKLRGNTIMQLDISSEKLREAEKGTGKQYLEVNRADVKGHVLQTIMKIEIGDSRKVEFHEPSVAEKFSLLRSEICSWEMLAGMLETEAAYLQQLVQIVEKVRFVRVMRPAEITIAKFHSAVERYLNTELHEV